MCKIIGKIIGPTHGSQGILHTCEVTDSLWYNRISGAWWSAAAEHHRPSTYVQEFSSPVGAKNSSSRLPIGRNLRRDEVALLPTYNNFMISNEEKHQWTSLHKMMLTMEVLCGETSHGKAKGKQKLDGHGHLWCSAAAADHQAPLIRLYDRETGTSHVCNIPWEPCDGPMIFPIVLHMMPVIYGILDEPNFQ